MTDIFQPYIQLIEKNFGVLYADHAKDIEVIVDHCRAIAWLIMDGALPSNKDQGYYLRRLIRRVATKLQLLAIPSEAILDLLDVVIQKLGHTYAEMNEKREHIHEVVQKEVKAFSQNLKKGLQYFEKVVHKEKNISAEDAFMLQTSYGFPIELITELA